MSPDHKIKPVLYKLAAASDSLAYRVAHRVSLMPLFGVVRPKQYPAILPAYMAAWRARVGDFERWKLHPAVPKPGRVGRKWRMLNCPPAFAFIAPRGQPCNVANLCPSCAARSAQAQWAAIDAKLFPGARKPRPTPGSAPHDRVLLYDDDIDDLLAVGKSAAIRDCLTLLVRSVTYNLPFKSPPPRNLRQFVANRTSRATCDGARRVRGGVPSRNAEIARFRGIGVVGGFDATRIGVARDRSAAARRDAKLVGQYLRPVAWTVEFRQLLFCDAGRADAIAAAPCVAHGPTTDLACKLAVKRYDAPTRSRVATEVGRALQYPAVMMSCGEAVITRLVAALDGHRKSAAFGILRGDSS